MSSSASSRLQGLFPKTLKHISAATTATTTATTNEISTTIPFSGPSGIRKLVLRFNKNSESIHFRSKPNNYESTVRRLTAGKHFSAIESILECLKKYIPASGEGYGVRLIVMYGKAGMIDHALKVFDELPQLNCPRTVFSFNALLSACVKSKNFDKVYELFEELPEKLEIEPDVFSYNTVIKAFCEENDFSSAMKMIEKMKDRAIQPDVVSYNTVLEAYYKENDLAGAEKLLQKMKETGVVGNVRTYNARIRNLVQHDQVQEAFELVEKMVKEEVNPDTHSYNALLKGYVGNGNLEEAKGLHRKMSGDGCLPDNITYQMLIPFACDKDDVDFALELCKQSLELNVFVHRSLLQVVVDALIKGSKTEGAFELVALVNSSKKHRYKLTLPVASLLE